MKYIALSLLFIFATVNFAKTTLDIMESSKRLEEAKSDVAAKEEDLAALEHELEYIKTTDFIEEEARNKLNLIKPGEKVFVMPLAQIPQDSTLNVLSAAKQLEKETPAQQWLELFF